MQTAIFALTTAEISDMSTSLVLVVSHPGRQQPPAKHFLDRNNSDFCCFLTHKVCVEHTYSAVASERACHWWRQKGEQSPPPPEAHFFRKNGTSRYRIAIGFLPKYFLDTGWRIRGRKVGAQLPFNRDDRIGPADVLYVQHFFYAIQNMRYEIQWFYVVAVIALLCCSWVASSFIHEAPWTLVVWHDLCSW